MSNLDSAFEIAKDIASSVTENLHKIRTEEDAKIQLITRLVTECLGWSFSDIGAEVKHENGFSDYLLSVDDKPTLLIEAKRVGSFEIGTKEKNKVRHLKLSGPALHDAIPGIEQASRYATPNGIPIAVLSDGVSWIIFKTFVPGENYQNKQAFVFPSLESLISDFSTFYELISKDAFGKKLYNVVFDNLHQNRLLLTQPLYAPIDENSIRISAKSALAFDLDRVFSKFFARLTGDEDADMLIDCFVESRESRIADFSLEKITANVLGNISPAEREVDEELANLIEAAVEVESGQTIFIVGPTGAGKTTFLNRFFQKTLSETLRRRCVVVRVNFLDASGSKDSALSWLTEKVISSLETQIYENGSPTWDDLLGLYFAEYQRRSTGVGAQLYRQDRDAFRVKFGEYLDRQVETDREGYLKKILSDAVRNRKKLPIILIDNTDEFGIDYKKHIFQYTQALRRHANHCLLIFPVTDKSAWAFSKTDMFGIYRSKSFFLPTPAPREVFRKRVEFLKQRLSGKYSAEERSNYLSTHGIRISVENLTSFAHVLENIFVDQEYTAKSIGELTNYNIRRTLLLSQRVITSSVFNIDQLVGSYVTREPIAPDFQKFMNALLKGDYEVFKHGDGHEIFPLFQVDQEIRQSPLLALRVLALLDSLAKAAKTIDDRHVTVQSVFDYFDAIGCSESSVDRVLLALLKHGLIEPYDTSVRDISAVQKLAISFSGNAHLRFALGNNVFLEQMALTTSIVNQNVAEEIKQVYVSNAPFVEKMRVVRELFVRFLLEEDNSHLTVPEGRPQYECQLLVNQRLESRMQKRAQISSPEDEPIAEESNGGIVYKNVVARVDSFDAEKGYGFTDIDGIDGQVFVHANQLSDHGTEQVSDGDELLCDVGRGEKGLYIIKVHDVETDPSTIETVECRIIRLFDDRGYGFVQIVDDQRDAFFHYSVVRSPEREKLKLGALIRARVIADRSGRGFQVKRIVSFLDADS